MRKTVAVEDLIVWANNMLADESKSDDFKWGVIAILNRAQHKTGTYNGFNYNDWLNGGCTRWHADKCPDDKTPYLGKETSRFYYKMR